MNSLMDRVGLHNLEEALDTFQEAGTRSRREQLMAAVFYRFAEVYDKAFYKTLRRFAEFSMLIHSLLAFTTLTTMHFTYINNPTTSNCLAHINFPSDRPMILRIEVKRSDDAVDIPSSPELPKSTLQDDLTDHMEYNNVTFDSNDTSRYQWPKEPLVAFDWLNCVSGFPTLTSDWLEVFDLRVDRMLEKIFRYFTRSNLFIIEYSQCPGLLSLSNATRKRLRVPIIEISLDPETNPCFGNSVYKRVFLEELFGFRDVVTISLENFLIANNFTEGYYKILGLNSVTKLSTERTTPLSRTIIAAVSMVIFVAFSSLLLQYSYNTFSQVIVNVLYLNNGPTSLPVGSMLVSVIAIIGFRDLMKYMFYDNHTFVLNLLVIWMANQFYTVCCHCNMSKRHWSKFFFLYHFAFYMYYVRHKGRFSVMAMMTSWFFIQHSMMYFFHHYELPAMHSQLRVRRALTELRRNGSSVFGRIRFRLDRNPAVRLDVRRRVPDDNNNVVPGPNAAARNSRGSRIRLTFMVREP